MWPLFAAALLIAATAAGCGMDAKTAETLATLRALPEMNVPVMPSATPIAEPSDTDHPWLGNLAKPPYVAKTFGTNIGPDQMESQIPILQYYDAQLGQRGWKLVCGLCGDWRKDGFRFQIVFTSVLPSSRAEFKPYPFVFDEVLSEAPPAGS